MSSSSVAARAVPRLASVLRWAGGGSKRYPRVGWVTPPAVGAPSTPMAPVSTVSTSVGRGSNHVVVRSNRSFGARRVSCARERPLCVTAAAARQDDSSSSSSSSASASEATGTVRSKHRLVFLGTPEVAAGVLEAILDAADAPDASFEVAAVVSQPGRPRGRGRSKAKDATPPPSPVAETALARGVPEDRVLCPVKANEPAFLDELRAMAPDLMVTAAYGNFLPQKFLDIPRLGTLNIHPSLLPAYRGAAPVQRALEAGVEVTGVSVAYTVLAMDAGPVLRRATRPLVGDEKHPELLTELFATGTKLLLDALPEVWAGDAAFAKGTTPQEELGEIIHAAKVVPDEAWLNFTDPGVDAATHHNKVRGFAGWPGTKSKFTLRKEGEEEGKEVVLKVITTRVGSDDGGSDAPSAGGVVEVSKTCLRVPCAGGGWLEVTELQPPGKKPMRAGDFANGLKGSVLAVAPIGE